MIEFFIFGFAIIIGLLLLALLSFQLAMIVFRPRINALILKHRASIIQRNRIRARGFLYSNTHKKDCWI